VAASLTPPKIVPLFHSNFPKLFRSNFLKSVPLFRCSTVPLVEQNGTRGTDIAQAVF
jgi:hypothetical protein